MGRGCGGGRGPRDSATASARAGARSDGARPVRAFEEAARGTCDWSHAKGKGVRWISLRTSPTVARRYGRLSPSQACIRFSIRTLQCRAMERAPRPRARPFGSCRAFHSDVSSESTAGCRARCNLEMQHRGATSRCDLEMQPRDATRGPRPQKASVSSRSTQMAVWSDGSVALGYELQVGSTSARLGSGRTLRALHLNFAPSPRKM